MIMMLTFLQSGLFFSKLESHIMMNKMIDMGVYKKYAEYDFQGTCAVERKYKSAGKNEIVLWREGTTVQVFTKCVLWKERTTVQVYKKKVRF